MDREKVVYMDTLTEPVTKVPRNAPDPATAAEWLDALSAGEVDQDTFLRGVDDLWKHAPEEGWELLALIDQYYRRNKITPEVFAAVKTHLQDLLMGKGRSGEISVPTMRPTLERTAALTVERSIPIDPPRRVGPTPTLVAASPAPPSPVAAAPATPRPRPAVVAPVAGAAGVSPPATADRPTQQSTERTLAPGDVLRGRYRVQALLGQGGMGTVFEAVDQYRLDRSNGEQKVALKVLHTAVIQRPRLFAELRREFQHLQSLSHPNIVRVHEFDRDGDLAFFTMEYLSGVLLSRVLATHIAALDRRYAWSIARDVGAAVVHAHSRGVVHGDLNPNNIFITDNGEVRVLDFGAAHPLRRTPWISEFESSQQINVATPTYASCQLLEGETADARDDVYALACITYVLLTGNHPYRGHSALKARTSKLSPARPAHLTRAQWQALRAGLQFDRDSRPSDVEAWLGRLISPRAAPQLPALPVLLAPPPVREGNLRWVAVLAVGILVLAGLWWVMTHGADISQAKSSVSARMRTMFADTVVSQLWTSDHDGAGARHPAASMPEPESAVPSPAPAVPAPTATALGSPRATQKPVPVAVQAAPAPRVTPEPIARPLPAPMPPMNAARVPATTAAGSVPATTPPVAAPSNAVRARIELAADSIDVEPGEQLAHVILKRSRTMRGEVSFSWWTESGTAKPGRDFSPVKSHVETMDEGKAAADLMIPILSDPGRHEPRSFYVVIDEPSENATLGQRTLSMVTIP
jgi:serine/threonine protein kinase